MSLWIVGEQHICIVAVLNPRIPVLGDKCSVRMWSQKLTCNTADIDNKQYVSCCHLQVTAE